MNVLVIAEDAHNDQHILRPLIRAMLAYIGKPQAKLDVTSSRPGGVRRATTWNALAEIIDENREVHLFLLIVDRDGVAGRRERLNQLEQRAVTVLNRTDKTLLAENAWQEIEVWVLAGMTDRPRNWPWRDIRAEAHAKERYFAPYAERRGLSRELGGGRSVLGREAASNYQRIRRICPEDVRALEDRIRTWIAETGIE